MVRCARARAPDRVEAKVSIRLLPAGALIDEIALAVQRHGRPLYGLFTTYTFDANLFTSQFLPLLCGEYAEDEEKVGLLVVCDARMYTGHRFGPWAARWPGSELFHPKVALLVFDRFTVLMAGSANLTHAGQYQQIEIWGKETWDSRGLPGGLASLLSRLEGALPRELLRLPRLPSKAFVSSLDGGFAQRLKAGLADEIFVISPFFDSRESAEVEDLSFVADLARRHDRAIVHLVVPVEANTSKSKVPRVQVDLRCLNSFKDRLRLYGVDPVHGGRPLHAKALAVCRNQHARLLFGSANATLAGMTRKNVEAGWFAKVNRPELVRWLRQQRLLDMTLNPNAVRSSVQSRKPSTLRRSPLERASLDEVEGKLRLHWRQGANSAQTEVLYGGKLLDRRDDIVHRFHIGRDWFVQTRSIGDDRASFAPIEIERRLAGARRAHHEKKDASPDSLLEALVAAPDLDPSERRNSRGRAVRKGNGRNAADAEPMFERVRRLAAAMAAAQRKLTGETPEHLATIERLTRIAQAHDPLQRHLDAREALWRYWVRAEVGRVLAGGPRSNALAEARMRVTAWLRDRPLPAGIRSTARLVRTNVVG